MTGETLRRSVATPNSVSIGTGLTDNTGSGWRA